MGQVHTKLPAKQARSQQTEAKLLDTLETMLRDEGIDYANLGVDQIANRAGVTSGAFYHRFENKEGLLRHLFVTRMAREGQEGIASLISEENCMGKSTWEVIRTYLTAYYDHLSQHRAVYFPLFQLKTHRKEIDVSQAARKLGLSALDLLRARLYERDMRIEHQEPMKALRVADLAAGLVIREEVFYGEFQGAENDTDWSAEKILDMVTDQFFTALFPSQAHIGRGTLGVETAGKEGGNGV